MAQMREKMILWRVLTGWLLESGPSNSLGIFDVFIGRCLETEVYLSAYYIAMVALIVVVWSFSTREFSF
jgi:hypothetical protein